MAKKTKVSVRKLQKPIVRLNSLFDDVMDTISFGADKTDSSRQRELSKMTSDIDNILSDEIDSLKSFTGDDISTFLVKLFNDYDSNSMSALKSIDDMFGKEGNGLFELFNERYKNKSLLYEDLQIISEHLFELEEAISSTRDAILTSDDISCIISRGLKFDDGSENDPTKTSYIKQVETLERVLGLLQKIKNHITPNTLRYGSYYVYTIPYSELFKSYYEKNAKKHKTTTLEAFTPSEIKVMKDELSVNNTTISSVLESFTSNITICNDTEALPIMEGQDISALLDTDEFRKLSNKYTKKSNNQTPYADAVKNAETEDFDGVQDCYIEYLDPRKVIPVKVLNKVIGYYYIHEGSTMEPTKNLFTNSFSFNTNKEVDTTKIENQFIGKLSDKIVKSFNKKFLEDNIKFKDLIANALIYNDLYRKKIRFQFIPAEFITEFAVNRDINDEGTSILLPSLLYAKLYYGILVFKIMSILSKSNDTRITYVKNSGLDKDVANQIQAVARTLKQRQITFNDLIANNANGMISKVGAGKDIYMPVGKSGERGLEFDILAGQDVQLNTDLMEMLRSGYISATGVPSVIMNYVNEADYAKTLVMANAKFVGRVISYQHDFNAGLTELYKKLMRYCTNIPEESISSFKFTLASPKSLNNMNLTDLITNADSVAAFVIKTVTGEQADQTEDDNKLKDILFNKIVREYLPMIQWNKMDEYYEESKLELAEFLARKKAKQDDEKTSNY